MHRWAIINTVLQVYMQICGVLMHFTYTQPEILRVICGVAKLLIAAARYDAICLYIYICVRSTYICVVVCMCDLKMFVRWMKWYTHRDTHMVNSAENYTCVLLLLNANQRVYIKCMHIKMPQIVMLNSTWVEYIRI